MRHWFILLGVFVLTVLPSLAQDATPVRIRITCKFPGSSAQEADEVVAGVLVRKFLVAAGLTKIDSHSKEDGTVLYLTFDGKADAAGLLAEVEAKSKAARQELPQLVTLGKPVLLAKDEAIPVLAPRRVERPEVIIYASKVAAHGLTTNEVNRRVATALGELNGEPDLGQKLEKLVLREKEPQIYLRDVATVTMKLVPDRVSRVWP